MGKSVSQSFFTMTTGESPDSTRKFSLRLARAANSAACAPSKRRTSLSPSPRLSLVQNLHRQSFTPGFGALTAFDTETTIPENDVLPKDGTKIVLTTPDSVDSTLANDSRVRVSLLAVMTEIDDLLTSTNTDKFSSDRWKNFWKEIRESTAVNMKV